MYATYHGLFDCQEIVDEREEKLIPLVQKSIVNEFGSVVSYMAELIRTLLHFVDGGKY